MRSKKHIIIALGLLVISQIAWAGNSDRSGQAGAGELLINPWAASSGLFALNVANVKGVEAMKNNIAGLANINSTQMGLSHCRYLAGTGMSISNIAVAQPMGKDKSTVIGVNVMTFGFGEIPVTTVDNPQGGIGSFKPTFFNASIGLGKKFSESMSAGLNVTFINEAVTNVRASALGLDAGVQYRTGKRDAFKIGITLRNIGTDLRFSGDGFKFDGNNPNGGSLTVQYPSEKFQLPSQLSIGTSLDIYLDEGKKMLDEEGNPIEAEYEPKHRLTAMASFKSNSYSKDWIGVGAEYAYTERFFLRAAYRYETDIISESDNTTFYAGIAAGVGFMTDFGKENGTKIAFDYGYNHTRFNSGNHVLSLRIFLAGPEEVEEIELGEDD